MIVSSVCIGTDRLLCSLPASCGLSLAVAAGILLLSQTVSPNCLYQPPAVSLPQAGKFFFFLLDFGTLPSWIRCPGWQHWQHRGFSVMLELAGCAWRRMKGLVFAHLLYIPTVSTSPSHTATCPERMPFMDSSKRLLCVVPAVWDSFQVSIQGGDLGKVRNMCFFSIFSVVSSGFFKEKVRASVNGTTA